MLRKLLAFLAVLCLLGPGAIAQGGPPGLAPPPSDPNDAWDEEKVREQAEVVTNLVVSGTVRDTYVGGILLRTATGHDLLVPDDLPVRLRDPQVHRVCEYGANVSVCLAMDEAQVTMVTNETVVLNTTDGSVQLPVGLLSEQVLENTRVGEQSLAEAVRDPRYRKAPADTVDWGDQGEIPGVVAGRTAEGDLLLITQNDERDLELRHLRSSETTFKPGQAVLVDRKRVGEWEDSHYAGQERPEWIRAAEKTPRAAGARLTLRSAPDPGRPAPPQPVPEFVSPQLTSNWGKLDLKNTKAPSKPYDVLHHTAPAGRNAYDYKPVDLTVVPSLKGH